MIISTELRQMQAGEQPRRQQRHDRAQQQQRLERNEQNLASGV